jgi:uncharacterized protein
VKEQLRLLERLQEIDQQIDFYEKDLDRLPKEQQELAKGMVGLRREIAEAEEKKAALEKELRRKEQELAAEQEKIKRSERRLLSIKNQKELNASSREVKLGKKVVGEIEETLLNLMSETEAVNKLFERKTKEYEKLESDLGARKTEIQQVTKAAAGVLEGLKKDREKVAVQIDRDYLKRYQIVRKARGLALVELENGICSGCHMSIPPQLNIRVLKQEEMIICPNCNRMLYVKPENIPEFNKMEP